MKQNEAILRTREDKKAISFYLAFANSILNAIQFVQQIDQIVTWDRTQFFSNYGGADRWLLIL